MDERIAEGVRLLDKNEPGWFDSIDLNALHMEDPCHCVLGQVYGDFNNGLVRIGFHGYAEAAEFGFAVSRLIPAWQERDEYDRLNAEWGFVIEERQRQSTPA